MSIESDHTVTISASINAEIWATFQSTIAATGGDSNAVVEQLLRWYVRAGELPSRPFPRGAGFELLTDPAEIALTELGLSTRLRNLLLRQRWSGFDEQPTVADLLAVGRQGLSDIRQVGPPSIAEVELRLSELGLSLPD